MQVNEISIQRVTQEGGLAIRQSNWPSDATMELLERHSQGAIGRLTTSQYAPLAIPPSVAAIFPAMSFRLATPFGTCGRKKGPA